MSPEAIEHLRKADKVMAKLIQRVGPCSFKARARSSPFQSLATAIIHQQLNGTAAGTILKRFRALYPHRRFPRPEDVIGTPEKKMRSAGLSGAKTAALKDLAERTLDGVVPTSRAIRGMGDEEIVERLTAVRGIGPWTAEMLLIFTLGRPDVLPATDYGVRKGFARTYGRAELPSPKELAAFGEIWRPHRSTAAWYLWRALELAEA
jgi:DNA-3-methyladenine glycosylase II